MKINFLLSIFILTILSLSFPANCQPIKIILDSDIDSDVDDVGAMAMLHTLADNKVIELLGIIVTSDDKYAPTCADAINHYYKRVVPIGVQKNIALKEFSKYTKQISEEFRHKLRSYEEAEDATVLYRKILSSQPDNSVTIITIGHLTNLSLLLNSKPDKYSPLTGVELVGKKVKLWSCMGGQFPEGKEANFYRPDPQSTVDCLEKWPGKVVFSGWEIGNKIITGGTYLSKMLPEKSPVRRGYELYNDFKGRQSWDQTSVLFAVTSHEYWELKDNGQCIVEKDGSNRWISGPVNPKQAYLAEKINPAELAKIIDALMSGIYKPGF
jgi:inosine-uridine nucleoside N-ribohydrolase